MKVQYTASAHTKMQCKGSWKPFERNANLLFILINSQNYQISNFVL